MSLNDLLAADTLAMLADFGEVIVYRPSGGAPRSTTAIVERFGGDRLRLTVANSQLTGIGSEEIDFDLDKVDVVRRVGEAAETRDLVRPADGEDWHDAGAVSFEVR